MKKILICAALAVAGLIAVGSAWGQDAKDLKPVNDVDFLAKAAACGVAEVKYSELAESRASNPKVKEFARKMAAEHKKANDKLAEFAKGLKTAILAGLEKDKQAIYDNLARLKGDDFDRAYMKQMVEDHEKAIQLFEAQSKTRKHEGLTTFASDTLPKLKEHLKEARTIQEGLGK